MRFPQGKGRQGQGFEGNLVLRQPRRPGLPYLERGQLLEVINSIYGLPDAARAWFDSLVEVIVSLGFTQTRLDVACFALRRCAALAFVMLLHVDDCLMAHDGSRESRDALDKLRERSPSVRTMPWTVRA